MPKSRSGLVFDIGLFDGEDTAYYLCRGHTVVAVDANPLMIEQGRLRFAKEIERGQLTLLNVGISDKPGSATFWISDVPEMSSFNKGVASRNNVGHWPLEIHTLPAAKLIAEYGTPSFMKIDIEGHDRLCLASLRGGEMPAYISVESECVSESDNLLEKDSLAVLELLRELGYSKFKLVDQSGWHSVRPGQFEDSTRRLIMSVARGRFGINGLSRSMERFTDKGRNASKLGYAFRPGSSGPWGEDVPGTWMDYDEARSVYVRERRSFFSRPRATWDFWYDWHATR